MKDLPTIAMDLEFANFRLRVGHLMTQFRGLRSGGRLAQSAVFRGGLDAADLGQIHDLETLVPSQGSGITAAPRGLDPLGGIRAGKISGFGLAQHVIKNVVAMEMHVPTIGMAVGHFHGTDIADFMRPAEKVLDAPMAPGLAPNLLRHLDDILQRIGALMPDRERAEHHAPIMFATVLHKRLHILETTGLNLVITDRADPNGTAGLQAGQTGAMRFIVEKALAGVLAQFPTAFTRASAAQNTTYRAPLCPAVTAQLRVSREIGSARDRIVGSGRITCNAIKGGFAAVPGPIGKSAFDPGNGAFLGGQCYAVC